MLALQNYGSSDEEMDSNESSKTQSEEHSEHLKPITPENAEYSLQNSLQICAAPIVVPTVC